MSTHVLVYGAGAVGAYFGALLARGGHEVTLVARGANLAALGENGVTVRDGPRTFRVHPARAVSAPTEAPPADLVLVCVKSYDTAAAAVALRPAIGAATDVLSLQNGVENEEVLARGLGLGPLLIALTRIGVELVAPATVAYSGHGTIVFGEVDGRKTARLERVAAVFERAGVPHRVRNDVRVVAWEKLAWNAGFNAVTALTGATVGEALDQPATRRIILEAMAETDAVATALGVAVRRDRLEAVLTESRTDLPDFATSTLQDVRRGRRLEHDALNGAVVRAAVRTGVPAPVNRLLAALLARLDPASRPRAG